MILNSNKKKSIIILMPSWHNSSTFLPSAIAIVAKLLAWLTLIHYKHFHPFILIAYHSTYNREIFLTSKLGFDDDSVKCGQWASTRLFSSLYKFTSQQFFFVCSNVINWANMRDDFLCVFFVSAHGIVHAATEADLMRMIQLLLHHRYYAGEI